MASDKAVGVLNAICCALEDSRAHAGSLFYAEKEEPFRALVIAHLARTHPELFRYNKHAELAPLQVEFPIEDFGHQLSGRADLVVLGDKSSADKTHVNYFPDVITEFKRNILHAGERDWETTDPIGKDYARLAAIHEAFRSVDNHHVSAIITWPSRWWKKSSEAPDGATAARHLAQEARYKRILEEKAALDEWLTLAHVEYSKAGQGRLVVEGELAGRVAAGDCPLGIR